MACRGLLVFQMALYSRDEWDDYRHPISAQDGDGKLFFVGGGGEKKNSVYCDDRFILSTSMLLKCGCMGTV